MLTKQDWIKREAVALDKADLPYTKDQLEAAAERADKVANADHHYFLPAGLTRTQLLAACQRIGIKLWSPSDDEGGEQLPTDVGLLECDLAQMMQPQDRDHRPFNLDYDQQLAWIKSQGGSDLCSVEEILYLLIRMWLEHNRLLFMGGWIRCRNRVPSGRSLYVGLYADSGVGVYWADHTLANWFGGTLPEKFLPLKFEPLEPSRSLEERYLTIDGVKYRRIDD